MLISPEEAHPYIPTYLGLDGRSVNHEAMCPSCRRSVLVALAGAEGLLAQFLAHDRRPPMREVCQGSGMYFRAEGHQLVTV